MDAQVFSKSRVAVAIHAGFDPLRVDMTKPGDLENAWAGHYGVMYLPTMLIVDESGRELARLDRQVHAAAFLDWLGRHGPVTAGSTIVQ